MTHALAEHVAAPVEEAVHSADGTRIGFRRLGQGPALVFVHGSVTTHTDWMPVARLLAGRFTCLVMDRRGRAHSGWGNSAYSLEREYEDIAAVLGAAGPGACLVGHSFGAICSLGAALSTAVPRLAIYDPPLAVGAPIAGEHMAPYSRALAEGDLDRALEIGLRHFTRYSPEEVAALRSTRAWPRLRTLAASWERELEVMDALGGDVERYRALNIPVLLMVGSESPEHPMQTGARALARVLPNLRMEVLEGQNHMGMRTAPALVSGLIGEFMGVSR